jgi:hypothetical protein
MNIAKFSILAGLLVLVAGLLPHSVVAFDGTDVCKENGQRYDAATWTRVDGEWTIEYQRPGYHTDVTGDATSAAWESNKKIRAVFAVTENDAVQIDADAKSGAVASDEAIDAIVLCLRGSSGHSKAYMAALEAQLNTESENTPEEPIPDVPEFGGILAVGTLGLLGAALVAHKRS